MNRILGTAAGLSVAALFISGCGGSSLSPNVSRIRAYDGATGTTAQAAIYINNGSANGDQNYEQVTPYLYVNSGASTFAWAVNGLTGGATTPFPANLNAGTAYSAILLGRADEQFGTSSPILDITADDQTAPPSGDSRYRLIHDAPDAGAVDVYINGQKEKSGYAYPGTTVVGVSQVQLGEGTPFTLQQFGYSNVAAGSVKVQVNEAGTNTIVAGPTNFSVTAGSRYTFLLLEPTTTPTPTYTLQQIGDNI